MAAAIFNVKNDGTLNPVVISASAVASLDAYDIFNSSRSDDGIVLWFYNKAAPVFGTDTPLFSVAIPPMSAARRDIAIATTGAAYAAGTALSYIVTHLSGLAVKANKITGHLVYG